MPESSHNPPGRDDDTMIMEVPDPITPGHYRFPIDTQNPMDWCRWCKENGRRNKLVAPPLKRFCIGIYQLHQAKQWQGDHSLPNHVAVDNVYECNMTTVLHITSACAMLNVAIEYRYESSWEAFGLSHERPSNVKTVLLDGITGALQQLVYQDSHGTGRRRSYSKKKLEAHTGTIIRTLVRSVPLGRRAICAARACRGLLVARPRRSQ